MMSKKTKGKFSTATPKIAAESVAIKACKMKCINIAAREITAIISCHFDFMKAFVGIVFDFLLLANLLLLEHREESLQASLFLKRFFAAFRINLVCKL